MNEYNFWADLLDTFQSSPDWIKALWLLIPPGFLLGLIGMLMRYRLAARHSELDTSPNRRLIYSIHRDVHGELQVVNHSPELVQEPIVAMLEHPNLEVKSTL